ncbi:agmatine deiminase family protein [Tateyamaria sp. SN6-1]|uniref:agmatine deiminase family protein n=1 Tax=Tateyamaria sp. SN6-1 TaxID=3092148 RepID=UPI0039F4C19F
MRRRRFLQAAVAGTLMQTGPLMAQDTLFVPPEEDPHAGTLMMWPASRGVYRDPVFLRMVQRTIAEIASTIASFEPVYLLADASLHPQIRKQVSGSVTLWDIPTEDLWARDAGPLFAWQGAQRVVSHIAFNGWGRKQVHTHDAQVAARIAARMGAPLISSGLQGEAGGVDHDGHGLLIAHESSWVIRNRNPGLSRAQITDRLLAAYGADRMIWSPGLRGQDITDYHIDSLARFTGPGRVLINLPDHPDTDDPFHMAALDTHDALTAAGLAVDVIPEPRRRRVKSPDFVASYANYYACNGAVIAAEFGDRDTDDIAARALARHYPGREIVTLNVDPLGEIGGGIHCATQQIPA